MVQIIPTVSEAVSNNRRVENLTITQQVPLSTINVDNDKESEKSTIHHKFRYLFTMRMMIAILMSSCLMALSVTTTNLAGSLVCMVTKDNDDNMANSRILR
uniref:Uncharacterized protein n=1 Tax=Setaria digitata TaxID=48799 RepID=A0A915PNK9_9BILA